MKVETAIQMAYGDGWRPIEHMKPKVISEDLAFSIWCSQGDGIFLAPKFWSSLGKAMGWRERCRTCGGEVTRTETPGYPVLQAMGGISECPHRCPNKDFEEGWKHEWYQFIDHLAEGGTIESFFDTM